MSAFLSIVIPTCNRKIYLKYAIASALNLCAAQNDIEIIVSENHSRDGTWEYLQSISDKRITIIRPPKALSAHEHFEYALSHVSGVWITFLGDDDAIMPHALEHLKYIDKKYTSVEALFSPRAYYFWRDSASLGSPATRTVGFSAREEWRDSKDQLERCLSGLIEYTELPQMYSGSFQKKTLVDRVRRVHGAYFKSVTPDANMALMGVLHTHKYLETGIPLSWVGTSQYVTHPGQQQIAKDRTSDLYGRLGNDGICHDSSLGNCYECWNFQFCFLDAYLSAAPVTNVEKITYKLVHEIFIRSCALLYSRGNTSCVEKLAKSLDFPVPSVEQLKTARLELASASANELYRYSAKESNDSSILSHDGVLSQAYARIKSQFTFDSVGS